MDKEQKKVRKGGLLIIGGSIITLISLSDLLLGTDQVLMNLIWLVVGIAILIGGLRKKKLF